MNNQDLEDKIIEVSTTVFTQLGYEKTSMSEIAQQMNISRPTLHYYFRTKDRLFKAVFGRIIRSFFPKIENVILNDLPFEHKLSAIIDEYLTIFVENPNLPRFVFSEMQRNPQYLIQTIKEIGGDRYVLFVRSYVLEEMKNGNVRTLPLSLVLLTFLSKVTFPFLTNNLLKNVFEYNDGTILSFLTDWKKIILAELKVTLLP